MEEKKLKMERVPYVPLTLSRVFLYYVCPLASILSLWLTLIPSLPFSGWPGVFIFLAIGIAATAYRHGRMVTKSLGAESARLVVLRLLGMVAFYGLLAWVMVGKCLPWLYTEAFGEIYSREVVATSKHYRSIRWCETRLYTPLMDGTYPNYICADGKGFSHMPNLPVVEVRLHGRKTILGATVDRIEQVRWILDTPRSPRDNR